MHKNDPNFRSYKNLRLHFKIKKLINYNYTFLIQQFHYKLKGIVNV